MERYRERPRTNVRSRTNVRFHTRERFQVKFRASQEPVWAEDEAAENEVFRREGRQGPILAPVAEANRTTADAYTALPDRLMAPPVLHTDDPRFSYYLFNIPTTVSVPSGLTPRRLRLRLRLEDASDSNSAAFPVAHTLIPGTEAVQEITNLVKFGVDLTAALEKVFPGMPHIFTAKAGGSLDLKRVTAKVQAEGRNSQLCGWRISDTKIAYDFNPYCVVQVPAGVQLSISAKLNVEVWKNVALVFYKFYLESEEYVTYHVSTQADPKYGITLDRVSRSKPTYYPEGETGQKKPLAPGGRGLCTVCGTPLEVSDSLEAYDDALSYCKNCLAMTLGRCSSCGTLIAGLKLTQNQDLSVYKEDFTLPISCRNCRSDFPWVTAQQKIYSLEQFIDRQAIDRDVRLLVGHNLMLLRKSDELDEVQRLAAWRRIKDMMPGLFESSVKDTIETLLTAEMKTVLGWNRH